MSERPILKSPDELKPCPKCASNYTQFMRGDRRGKPGIYVWCSSCGISGSLKVYDPIIASGEALAREAVVKDWNTRHGS